LRGSGAAEISSRFADYLKKIAFFSSFVFFATQEALDREEKKYLL